MGDRTGERRRARGVEGHPAITPEMLWPMPRETRERQESRGRRVNHPSIVADAPGPRLVLTKGRRLVDLSNCGNGCGKGVWCEACRADIRAEALHWLRELNVLRPSGKTSNLSWSRAWSRDVLLADR